MPGGSLEFSTLLLPAGVEPIDKLFGLVFGCFGVYSSAGAVFRMTVPFKAIELFDDFIAVCKIGSWVSDWFAIDD